MPEHHAEILWSRASPDFTYERYNRDHIWRFEGDVEVPASAAPAFRGSVGRVDPEEAFVAAVSSCHMLTFLAIAARKRYVVESYSESAVGCLEKNAAGNVAITRVVLRPRIEFDDAKRPDAGALRAMHTQAHKECFIANSVSTEITLE